MPPQGTPAFFGAMESNNRGLISLDFGRKWQVELRRMPESIKTQEAPHLSEERGESFVTRALDPFQKMTTLTKTVSIVSIMAVTLLCYLAKDKVFKKRPNVK